MKKQFFVGLVICFLALTQWAINEKLWKSYQQLPQANFSQVEKWSPEVFKVVQFGHVQSAVDWLLLRFLVASSHDEARTVSGRHISFLDLDLATDLDPAFFELYWAGGNFLSVVFNDGISARELLLKGDRFRKEKLPAAYDESFRKSFWNSAWAIPLLLAYVNIFELDDMKAGGVAFREAAQIPGSPKYLLSLQQRFEKPGGEYAVGIQLINFMIENTPRVEEKKKLEAQKQWLFVSQYIHQLNLEFTQFLESHSNDRSRYQLTKFFRTENFEMDRFWKEFRKAKGLYPLDPWGGRLEVSTDGRIVTSTPHEKVMGLE